MEFFGVNIKNFIYDIVIGLGWIKKFKIIFKMKML